MDLNSHLPPPSFYLSTLRTGRLWLFSDVPVLPQRYTSDVNVTPLPGMNAPYVSQGSGGGWTWAFEAKLNPWHKFLTDDASTAARDPGSSVYDDYLEMLQFIEDNGPSPLLMLHRPAQDATMVALTDFGSELGLSQDTFAYDGQLPSTIPVSMTLIEVPEYRVRFE